MNINKKSINIDKLRQGVFFAARGGGVRASAAIGVLKALEEAKIPIKGLSGESGSSIVVALYACGYDADEVLRIFLKYNNAITKGAKVYGGKGAIVVEEIVNEATNHILMKDLPFNCWINACQGSLLKPELYLFSNKNTPDETLGAACAASAGLPIFYGNSYKYENGKRIKLFDGGFIYNPYIPPDIDLPIVYASYRNTIDYQRFIPFLHKPVDAVNAISDVVITSPVGGSIVTGSNEVIKTLAEAGYQEAQKVLCMK